MLSMGQPVQEITIARVTVIYFLQSSFSNDFVINQKTSVLTLVQNVEFPGLMVYSKSMTLKLTEERVSKSFNLLQNNFSQSGDTHFRTKKIIRPSLFHNTSSTSSTTAVSIFTTATRLSKEKERVIQHELKSLIKMADGEFKEFSIGNV